MEWIRVNFGMAIGSSYRNGGLKQFTRKTGVGVSFGAAPKKLTSKSF